MSHRTSSRGQPLRSGCSTALFLLNLLTILSVVVMLAACQPRDPDAMMRAARQFRAQGDIKAAIIELKNAIHHDRANRAARLMLAELHLDLGDAAAAEKELLRASANGADDGATLMLAQALLAQGSYQRVLADVGEQAAPARRPAVMAARASALIGLGKVAAARTLLEQAARLGPSAPGPLLGQARIALAELDTGLALQLVERALAANPQHIDCLRMHAALLRAVGRPQDALTSQGAVLKQRPHHVQALVELAGLLTDTGRWAEARTALRAARRLVGNSASIVLADAQLDHRANKPAAALEKVQRVLAAAPAHVPALLLAGTLQAGLGAHEQAAQHLQAILQVHPQHPDASKRLAALRLQQGQPDQALTLLLPLLDRHADDPDLLGLAGESHLRLRQFGAAAGRFERAIAVRPADATLHAGLATAFLGSGQKAGALAALERAAGLEGGLARIGPLLVMGYLEAGRPAAAMRAIDSMERQGSTALSLHLRGAVLLVMQQPARARASFEQALVRDPAYLPALNNLVQLDAFEGRNGQPERRYLAALARAPRSSALMGALADLALARGRPAEAVVWMERALAAQAEGPTAHAPPQLALALQAGALYLRAGEPRRALALATRARASNPGNAEALRLLAHAAGASGQPALAIDAYTRLQALAPSSALPWLEIGQLHLAYDQAEAALAALDKALALAPGLASARIVKVGVLIRRGAFDEARASALAARALAPRAPIGDKLLGDVESAQGRHGAALQAYERAHTLAPSGASVVQLANALARLGRQQAADARIEAWLRAHPRDAATRLHYASSQLIRHNDARAIPHYEAVLKQDARNIAALNDLAWSYQRIGSGKALDTGLRAYALAPGNPAVMDTLGWIYVQQGQSARALPLLRRASLLAPGVAQIDYHLAAALAQSGDRAGARRLLDATLRQHGAFAEREQASALLARL